MMRNLLVILAAWAALCATSSAANLFFDFGDSAQMTAGNYNNVTPVQDPVLNAVDSTGALTGIGLSVTGFNELGPNLNGTQTPGAPANVFAVSATRDNLFGHSDNFNIGSPRPSATLTLAGLDGSGLTQYAFTFFASRTGATDNRETKYDVTGANNSAAFLNASANVNNVAIVSGITPTAAGGISIVVSAGPNNNNGSRFYYLGAMLIESRTVPEPATLGLGALAAALCAQVARRRR